MFSFRKNLILEMRLGESLSRNSGERQSAVKRPVLCIVLSLTGAVLRGGGSGVNKPYFTLILTYKVMIFFKLLSYYVHGWIIEPSSPPDNFIVETRPGIYYQSMKLNTLTRRVIRYTYLMI